MTEEVIPELNPELKYEIVCNNCRKHTGIFSTPAGTVNHLYDICPHCGFYVTGKEVKKPIDTE